MAPPKDIARSYPKRGLTADVGFRSEPKFCGDGSIELNGSSQYLNAELSSALGDSFTIMGWAKREGPLSSYNYIVNTGASSGAGNAVSISITNTNPGILYFFDNSTSVNTSNTVEFNEWFHFALTVAPGAGNVKLYKNGIDGTPSHSVAIDLSDVTFEVGRRLGGIFYFRGKIFDLRVYDETLTQDQIRELLNNPGQTVPTGLTSADLIHRYLLETDANDSGATGNNLTANNSPTFGVDRAQLPRGLDLARGAAMARVYTGRALDQDGSVDRLQGTNFTDATATACTVSFWMYQRDGGPGRIIHNFGGGATAVDRFIAFMSSSSFYIAGEITSGNRLGFTLSSLPLNQWHHVVFVLDGNGTTSLNTTILYLNGEKYDSPGAVGVIWDTTTFDIGGTSHGYQNQLIAGVKVFNTKLTDAQARELYHNPEQVLPTGVSASNLRRYYPLSDYNDTGGTGGRYFQDMGADGEPLEDIGSCSMEFAQPVPCPQLGLQQSASRIYFDGVGGGSTGPYWSANLSTAPGATFSLAYWIWYDSSLPIYSMVTEGGGQHYIQTAGNIIWYDGGGTASFNGAFPSSKQDRWTHVVMTSTASSPYAKCYVDGVEQTASGAAGGAGMTATSFSVFARAATTVGFHKGFCANMAIFDDALSSAEVTELFNQGIGYDLRNDTGDYASSAELLNYWLFDDLTSVVDRKGSNNLTNPTSTAFSGMASFPENASGSTIVGDFSMKRKGVSVLNCFNDPPAQGVRTEIPKGAGLAPSLTDGHAVSVWYRNQKQDTTSANNGTMVTFGTASGNDRFIIEALNGNSFRGIYGAVTATSTATISDNDWHHYAMVLDVTTSPNPTVRVYLDGVAAGTATGALSTTFPDSVTTIGWMTSAKAGFNYGLKGPLACPRIYSFQLSENEIKQIYNADYRLIRGLDNE